MASSPAANCIDLLTAARLAVLERKGVAGAGVARRLKERPQIFLPTVQVGITLVSVVTGMFSGERVTVALQHLLERSTLLRPIAHGFAFLITVVAITFLTMVLGELVPKQLALRWPELLSSRVAPCSC